MIIGHTQARELLERELPPVTLLRGPESVGKWQLGLHLLSHHGVLSVDQRTYRQLDMGAARDILAFAERAPFGTIKCVLLDTDTASQQVLNALLKLLEEPPATVKFILVSSKKLLDTITSRAAVYNLGLLSEEEVYQVLASLQTPQGKPQFGFADAHRLASLSRGQVGPALTALRYGDSKDRVIKLLSAVAARDRVAFDRALGTVHDKIWEQVEENLLFTWAYEAITKRWRIFTEAESFGLEKTTVPNYIIRRLRANSAPALRARAQLAVLLDV